MHILSLIGKVVVGVGLSVASLLGVHHHAAAPTVGSAIPNIPAFTSDTLASGIGKTDTSITLVTGTDSQSRALAGFYGFVIDEGSASQEIVTCTAAGTSLTGCVRGIDTVTGTTSVIALEQSHRRGASVKITNAPFDSVIFNIVVGKDGLPYNITNNLHYDLDYSQAQWTAMSSTTVPDLAYVQRSLAAGAVNASESANGIDQLATGAQASAGTSAGSTGGRLVLPASLATSTCQFAQNSVLIASSTSGKLSGNCLDTANNEYTWSKAQIFNATTTNNATSTFGGINGSALRINNLNYLFPGTRAASSTVLCEDGAGNLSWCATANPLTLTSNTDVSITNGFATSSAVSVPANYATASTTFEVDAYGTCSSATSNNSTCTVYLRTAAGATLGSFTHNTGTAPKSDTFQAHFIVGGTANFLTAQNTLITGLYVDGAGVASDLSTEATSAQTLSGAFGLVLVAQAGNANYTTTISGYSIRVRR